MQLQDASPSRPILIVHRFVLARATLTRTQWIHRLLPQWHGYVKKIYYQYFELFTLRMSSRTRFFVIMSAILLLYEYANIFQGAPH